MNKALAALVFAFGLMACGGSVDVTNADGASVGTSSGGTDAGTGGSTSTPPDILVETEKWGPRIVLAGKLDLLAIFHIAGSGADTACVESLTTTSYDIPVWDRPTAIRITLAGDPYTNVGTVDAPLDEKGIATVSFDPGTMCLGPNGLGNLFSITGWVPEIKPSTVPGEVAHSGDRVSLHLQSLKLESGQVVEPKTGDVLAHGPSNVIRKSQPFIMKEQGMPTQGPDGKYEILRWSATVNPYDGRPFGLEYFAVKTALATQECAFFLNGIQMVDGQFIKGPSDTGSFFSFRFKEVIVNPGDTAQFALRCDSPGMTYFDSANVFATTGLDCTFNPFASLAGPYAPTMAWSDFSEEPHDPSCSSGSTSVDFIGDALVNGL
jgi:hypothetical protein